MDLIATDNIIFMLDFLNGFALRALALSGRRYLKIIWRYMRFYTIPGSGIVSWRREILSDVDKRKAVRISYSKTSFAFKCYVLATFMCKVCFENKVYYKYIGDPDCATCKWHPLKESDEEFETRRKKFLSTKWEAMLHVDIPTIVSNESMIIPYDPNGHLSLPVSSYAFYKFREHRPTVLLEARKN